MYLYISGPGIIHQNGNGPDPVLHRPPGRIFHPDFRFGFIAGISGRGTNGRYAKTDEEKTKAENRERAER
jgi:hypothetical protein